MGKRLRRMARKKAFASPKARHITGILSATGAGFGFVNTPDETFFIPPGRLNRAITGDVVEVAVTNPHDPKGASGEIVCIVSREREMIACELTSKFTARALDKNIPDEIRVCGSLKGAKKGDWVNLRLLSSGKKYTEALRGSVEERIGKANTIEGDLKAVTSEYGLCEAYSPEFEHEAQKIVPSDKAPRTDLPDLFCVTIDPADAHDFDDALSIEDLSAKEWKIGIHIADVASYIRPGTKFDKAARKRAFSSYIPGMFRPMLPKNLTSKMSLQEGVLSLAHSVFLRVRKRDGAILSSERFFTRITIGKRLNYDEVQDFFEGKKISSWDKKTVQCVTALLKAAGKMRTCRAKKEEFLHIDNPEIRLSVSRDLAKVESLNARAARFSEQLVEECMLAANSAVAEELIMRKCAGLYRIHPEPDPAKMEEYMELAFSVLRHYPGDLAVRKICNDFLDTLPDNHRKYVLVSAFLRTMARASYSQDPGLHYGLGKSRYSHFTSPIRRYTDLVIHQQLHALTENTRLRSRKMMSEIALECSRKEENNDNAYFATIDRLKLHYLKDHHALENNDLYEGVIVKISKQAWVCDVPSLGLRGSVPAKYIPVSRKNQQKVGNLVYLALDSLDFARSTAVFRPSL